VKASRENDGAAGNMPLARVEYGHNPSGNVTTIKQLEAVTGYLSKDQIDRIRSAFELAEQAHHGIRRKSGKPYITHPLAVAGILAGMRMDCCTVMAALLHDTIEDTAVTKAQLAKAFGEDVADLVDGVTKLEQVHFCTPQEQAAENFIKMMLAMSRDIRVILIKLADRLHNMRTLKHMVADKRLRIAQETLEVYAPIAHRLGMHAFKEELEALGFAHRWPLREKVIARRLLKARGQQQRTMENVRKTISKQLKHQGMDADVSARLKSPYSIYLKMRFAGKRFANIHDMLGFRVITETVEDCYRTLGVVHNLYPPVRGRFKDYIAIPKRNGYQSLHSGLRGPHDFRLEVQIRTRDMNRIAQSGIAAHWLYKKEGPEQRDTRLWAHDWLSALLEIQKEAGNSVEFLENVKVDLFPNEIYVFTPTGEVRQLPRKATVLDFAYAVHTDLGNHCVAARVDQQITPLRSELQNGQTVEIISVPSGRPKPDWLSFVTTNKARTGIRHFLRNLQHEDAVLMGHRMLDRAMDSVGASLDAVPQKQLDALLKKYRLPRLEALLADIALGNQRALIIAGGLLPKGVKPLPGKLEAFAITGSEGRVLSFARCCYPIPGDKITGYMSAGKGLVIHTHKCHNLPELKKTPERCIGVTWDAEVSGNYVVPLRVDVSNKPGVLAMLASIIAKADSNIEHMEYIDRDTELATLLFQVTVKNRIHLANIIRRVRRNSVVIKAQRALE